MNIVLLLFLVSPGLFVSVATEQETETHHGSFKTITKNLHQHSAKDPCVNPMLGWERELAKVLVKFQNLITTQTSVISDETQALLDSRVQDFEEKVVNTTQDIINTQSSELSDRTQDLLDSKVQDLKVKVENATQDMVKSFKNEMIETLEKNQREMYESMTAMQELLQKNREENLEMQESMRAMQELLQTNREERRADFSSLQERLDDQLKRYFDCSSVPVGSPSRVYYLFPNSSSDVLVEAYCELEHGEEWTVILNRSRHEEASEATNFNRTYKEYKQGFGVAGNDFWAGLDNIHSLTSARKYMLRIDLTKFSNETAYAIYDHFSIGGDSESYKLNVGGYISGNAGDSLDFVGHRHNGRKFSTYDRDQDRSSSRNCPQKYGGGWWYNTCGASWLTGRYKLPGTGGYAGIYWYTFNYGQPLREASMKIRPARN